MGAVRDSDDDNTTIYFPQTGKEPMFKTADLDKYIRVVDPATVPVEVARAATTGPQSTRAKPASSPCKCRTALDRPRYTKDSKWRSCPSCSVRHGAAHVFRRSPEAFGEREVRSKGKNDDDAQSWCKQCRNKENPDLTGDDVRLCTQVKSRLTPP